MNKKVACTDCHSRGRVQVFDSYHQDGFIVIGCTTCKGSGWLDADSGKPTQPDPGDQIARAIEYLEQALAAARKLRNDKRFLAQLTEQEVAAFAPRAEEAYAAFRVPELRYSQPTEAELARALADLDARVFSPEELALADGALADLASRRDEDPAAWASRLAAQVCSAGVDDDDDDNRMCRGCGLAGQPWSESSRDTCDACSDRFQDEVQP